MIYVSQNIFHIGPYSEMEAKYYYIIMNKLLDLNRIFFTYMEMLKNLMTTLKYMLSI